MVPIILTGLAKVEDTRAAEMSQMREEVVNRVGEVSLMYLDKHVKARELSDKSDED